MTEVWHQGGYFENRGFCNLMSYKEKEANFLVIDKGWLKCAAMYSEKQAISRAANLSQSLGELDEPLALIPQCLQAAEESQFHVVIGLLQQIRAALPSRSAIDPPEFI